jgi:hypothetical protein
VTKVYLDACFSRREEMLGYAGALGAMGHTITSRWVQGGEGVPDEDSDEDLHIHGADYAAMDIADVHAAELLILFTDGPVGRGGLDVEFGMAISLGKALWIVGPLRNPFHYLPQVQHFDTWDECLAAMDSEVVGSSHTGVGTVPKEADAPVAMGAEEPTKDS